MIKCIVFTCSCVCLCPLQYSCADNAVGRQQLYVDCIETCDKAVSMCVRSARRILALEKRNEFLQRTVAKQKELLDKLSNSSSTPTHEQDGMF